MKKEGLFNLLRENFGSANKVKGFWGTFKLLKGNFVSEQNLGLTDLYEANKSSFFAALKFPKDKIDNIPESSFKLEMVSNFLKIYNLAETSKQELLHNNKETILVLQPNKKIADWPDLLRAINFNLKGYPKKPITDQENNFTNIAPGNLEDNGNIVMLNLGAKGEIRNESINNYIKTNKIPEYIKKFAEEIIVPKLTGGIYFSQTQPTILSFGDKGFEVEMLEKATKEFLLKKLQNPDWTAEFHENTRWEYFNLESNEKIANELMREFKAVCFNFGSLDSSVIESGFSKISIIPGHWKCEIDLALPHIDSENIKIQKTGTGDFTVVADNYETGDDLQALGQSLALYQNNADSLGDL